MSPDWTRRRLKAAGVHTRKLVDKSYKQLMVRLYLEGVSVALIARVFDVSDSVVYQAIRAHKWRNIVSSE